MSHGKGWKYGKKISKGDVGSNAFAGFELVVIDPNELIAKLDEIMSCGIEPFKNRLLAIVEAYIKGKGPKFQC